MQPAESREGLSPISLGRADRGRTPFRGVLRQPQRSQVAEYRGKAVAPTRCGTLEEDVQHEPTISTLLGSFWEQPFLLWQYALRFSGRLRVEESAFNRATGATSTGTVAKDYEVSKLGRIIDFRWQG